MPTEEKENVVNVVNVACTPLEERQIRNEALQKALNRDSAYHMQNDVDVIRTADMYYRFIANGDVPNYDGTDEASE